MNFGLTADIHWETKVDISLGLVPQREFRDFFYSKNYGTDINKFVVVLMCRNSEYNFKQRIRFIKKEKALYMDIMLDFDLFLKITQEERNRIVFEKLIKEVPEIIAKYKFKNFDLDTFKQDWTGLIKSITY